jgi:hypothetical protein
MSLADGVTFPRASEVGHCRLQGSKHRFGPM